MHAVGKNYSKEIWQLNPQTDANQYINKSIFTKIYWNFLHKNIFMKSSLGQSSLDSGKKCSTQNLDSKQCPSEIQNIRQEIVHDRRKCFRKHLTIKIKKTDPS